MPQVFRIGAYTVYFWSNEERPKEPVHVHVCEGSPKENSTKIWITRAGKCVLCHNHAKIPLHQLRNIMDIIEAQSNEIIEKWEHFFGIATYYC